MAGLTEAQVNGMKKVELQQEVLALQLDLDSEVAYASRVADERENLRETIEGQDERILALHKKMDQQLDTIRTLENLIFGLFESR